MLRLDHREPMPKTLRGAILALGNFDGFHQGHQAVVGEAIRWARSEGRPCIVATFDPHPMRHFRPDAEPFRLTTLDQRQEMFDAAGADAMLVFHFDAEMASQPAAQWAEGMISQHIGAAGVVTGEDFTFGKGRGGNPALLRERGVETRAVPAVHDDEGPISSSRIREALKAGDCETATRLLTRPFAIRGTVQHLSLGSYLRPRYGIYAVTGLLPGGRVVHGAANIGIRPTFDPPVELLEPYFFDFSDDLYDQEIEVGFHHFLRGEAKFNSLEELTAQMEKDCVEARAKLGALPA
jgi:riboflavin kinase / FMN adenylyltransferase